MDLPSALLLALFVGTGLWHLRAVMLQWDAAGPATRAYRRVVDAGLHVLMSAAMLAMLAPDLAGAGDTALTVSQVVVFGGGVVWFVLTSRHGRLRWFDATAMAAMVWMLVAMRHTPPAGGTSTGHSGHAAHGGHALPRVAAEPADVIAQPTWVGVVTVALVTVLVVGAALRLHAWRRSVSRTQGPGSGADGLLGALMGTGMALSLVVMGS